MSDASPLLDVRSVTKVFHSKGGLDHTALDEVSFSVSSGEILGIVGESGSGKTTLVRTILRLTQPTSGQIVLDGLDVWRANRHQRKLLPGLVQVIFQDPYASLDPRISISKSITEGSVRVDGKRAAAEAVDELLDLVSLPRSSKKSLPVRLSGGQRQRVAIARGARHAAHVASGGRTCERPRCVHAGTGAEPSPRPARPARSHLRFRQPRPVDRAAVL